MEKYTKFDDPSNGLNPFLPEKPNLKFEGWKKIARNLVTYLLICMRLPMIGVALGASLITHTLKFLFLHPWLIRWAESFYDGL